jgi:hypothetical protein
MTVIASDSEAIQEWRGGDLDSFVAHAPLRKRFAFVAGHHDSTAPLRRGLSHFIRLNRTLLPSD